jgi:hypothetical protein
MSQRRFPPPWTVEELDAMLAHGALARKNSLTETGGCREDVLSCLPRGDRAGCDLVDCPQRCAGAGRHGI